MGTTVETASSNQANWTSSSPRIRESSYSITKDGDLPQKKLATVILPAYNEAPALPTVLKELITNLDGYYEIIVVDDGSSDDTFEVASQFPCRVIRHKENQGKGAAVRTGIKYARGDYIIIMDADATYPASPIPGMIDMLCHSSDVVRCIRNHNKENMPLTNRLGNILFDLLLKKIARLDGADYLSGLYGLRKDLLCNMQLESDGFDLEAEISMKARTLGLNFGYLPIVYRPRLGEKKLNAWRDGWNIFNRILFLALIYNPIAAFILPGLIIMSLGIIGGTFLSKSSIVTPYFGLNIHSFILAILATLVGFQLAVFGVAASIYGIQAGHEPDRWVKTAVSTPVRLGAAGFGALFFFISSMDVLNMIAEWLLSGAGAFTGTRDFIIAITGLVGGMQLLSDAMFISIFSMSVKKKMLPNPAVL